MLTCRKAGRVVVSARPLRLKHQFATAAVALGMISSAPAANIELEAENGMRTGTTVTTAAAGYSGTGYVTGFDATGDNVRWTFSATSGLYNLRIRFRSQYGPKGFDATLNGATTSGMFPQNASFATQEVGLVELTNGNNTLSILSSPAFGNSEMEILNLNGQKMIIEKINSGISKCDLSSLLNGFYFLSVANEKGRETKKFVLVR